MCRCPVCGNLFPIPRAVGYQRKYGHPKDIWCPFCKAERTFTEIKNYY